MAAPARYDLTSRNEASHACIHSNNAASIKKYVYTAPSPTAVLLISFVFTLAAMDVIRHMPFGRDSFQMFIQSNNDSPICSVSSYNARYINMKCYTWRGFISIQQ